MSVIDMSEQQRSEIVGAGRVRAQVSHEPAGEPIGKTGDCRPVTFSAILPTYNSSKFVSRAIDSVLSQDRVLLTELIVVDDCSGDGTLDFIKSRYQGESRVKFHSTERNGGPGAARNLGIAAASGSWIALIDADDAWTTGRLNRLAPECRADIDLVFDNVIGYDHGAAVTIGTLFPALPKRLTIAALMAGPQPGSTFDFGYLKPLMRRCFLMTTGVAYEPLRVNEDLLFYLELLANGAMTRGVDAGGYIYTTPVGLVSLRRSEMSATFPDNMLVASHLDAVTSKYKDRLNTSDLRAIGERAIRMRTSASISRVHALWMRRRYLTVIREALSQREVRTHLLRKLGRRILRQAGFPTGGKGS